MQTISNPRDASKGPPGRAARGLPARPPLKTSPRAGFPGASAPVDCNPQAATCASPRAGVCRRQWRKQADEGPMRHRAYRLALVQAGMRQCRIARFNRMLLPISICGRKMSIFGHPCPEMPFYSKLRPPSKDCLQTFDGRASTLSML